jgi:hypothetical protein
MAMVDIDVDFDAALRGFGVIAEDKLPFIIALTLTKLAQDGQAAARALEGATFKLRNDWTTQNTRITPATKQTLASAVYTDTSNSKTGAPDYLPPQEDGGVKVPFGGHQHIAIPTKYLLKYTSIPIPDAMRPKNLLPPDAELGTVSTGSFTTTSRPRKAVSRASRKKLGSSEFEAFVQRANSGTLCIFVHHGGISYHGGSQDAEPWYILVPAARVPAIFPMGETVETVVDDNLDRDFTRAAAESGINDALRGSGLTVKL